MKSLLFSISALLFSILLPAMTSAGEERLSPLPPLLENTEGPGTGNQGEGRAPSFSLPIYGDRLPGESMIVSAFELDPLNETRELVVTQYSGDHDCCTDIVVFTNTLDGWKVVDFSWGLEQGSRVEDFIKDPDGDGNYELLLDKIYHIENGEVLEQDCSRFDMIGPNQMIKRCRAF